MAIIFENIDTKETMAIDRQTGGKFYREKLSALMNSSNMSINADRGQDYGWRLQPEQQAILEVWEEEPDMIDKVSKFTNVPLDALSHADFLAYFLYQQELGTSPEKAQDVARREVQAEYEARVAALKAQEKPEAMSAFDASQIVGIPDSEQVDNAPTEANTMPPIVDTVALAVDTKKPIKK